jgi:hypothetical protein
MSIKYLLLGDPDREALSLQETALKYFYGGDIVLATTSSEVLAQLKSRGKPELLFVDFSFITQNDNELHKYLEEDKSHFPVITCSAKTGTDDISVRFPMVSAILEKPISVDAFTYLVKGIMTAPLISPGYLPVSINTVLEHGIGDFDFFLKLSGTNFVKILNKGDGFSKAHAEKLQSKGIHEIHIKASDSQSFLKIWEENLKFVLAKKSVTTVEGISIAMETLEQVEGISKALGWTKEVMESAKKTVEQAIGILSKDVSLSEALKKRLANPASKYSMHVGMLCYLNCCLSTHLDWTNDSGQIKLAMASLLHDFSIDDSYYEDIDAWNLKALNLKDKSPETIRYRMHPLEGAKLAQSLECMPPDVDQIILQHHEKKDGTGFPRSLTASRITHLSTLFIMVEDLVNFISRGEHLETSIKDYLVWGEYYYDQGNFKKIFDIIKQKLP